MKPVEVLFIAGRYDSQRDSASDAPLPGHILEESPIPIGLRIARDSVQALQMLADPEFKPELIILERYNRTNNGDPLAHGRTWLLVSHGQILGTVVPFG
jgi:hypothetical protein